MEDNQPNPNLVSNQYNQHEREAIQRGASFKSKQIEAQAPLQEPNVGGELVRYVASNEACLFQVIPVIKERSDAIVGVGSDQVLDLLTNSESECACIVDYTPEVSLTSRMLLEIGVYHKKIAGEYPDSETFINYFEKGNQEELLRILSLENNFDESQLERLSQVLSKDISVYGVGPLGSGAKKISYAETLEFKSNAVDHNRSKYTWLRNESSMAKVFDLYEQGNILVCNGDITNSDTMNRIGENLKSKNQKVGVVYWSNAEDYIPEDAYPNLPNASEKLPLNDDAVIIRAVPDLNENDFPNKTDQIKDNPILNKFLMPWHNNIQTFADWAGKMRTDDTYAQTVKVEGKGARLGFWRDIWDMQNKPDASHTGLSIIE